MRRRRWIRGAAAAVTGLCAVVLGSVALVHGRAQLAVLTACEATQAGDHAAALAGTEGRVGTDETGRAAAECRCQALIATGREAECTALLEALLDDPDSEDWAPQPALAIQVIQARRAAGRSAAAAALARRAARAHPTDARLFHVELATRASVENEEALLAELEARIPVKGAAAARMRATLAQRHLQRGDPETAIRVLGEAPPDGADPAALGLWFDTLGVARAMRRDVAGARAAYAAWQRAGGDPDELRARYALALSIAGVADPEQTPAELLSDALAAGDRLRDDALHESLVIRLVLTLVGEDRLDEALSLYDRYSERFPLEGLSRGELLRAARHRSLAGLPREARRGRLRFRLQKPVAGDVLWLSPEPDAPVDSDYQAFRVPPSGLVTVERAAGVAPQRWVLGSGSGAVLASGTLSPAPGELVEIAIHESRGAAHARRPALLIRRSPDGHRRVALVLLDCADWRIVQYLRQRGDLPVLDTLLARGRRAVLASDPPLTAAALEALVWPTRHSEASVVGLAHRLGTELSGLASVGDNPFAALAWVLPESDDLFTTIGSGDRSAANLLLSHGGIRAGRHGEVTGPHGERRRVPLGTTARDLDRAERERFPELADLSTERDTLQIRTIAAELDVTTELLRKGSLDLLAVRIEPLDILTHAHFAEAVRDGQDDGRGVLFATYRYIDARLQALHDALDADDVLIVMSDHGIRTAMEHAREALFVATGPDITPGRAQGEPALRGVARVVADLLGVETDWPDTGVAPWARRVTTAATQAGLGPARSEP